MARNLLLGEHWTPEGVKEQADVIRNNKKMAQSTLRQLSLTAVVDYRHFFVSATKKLHNLPSGLKIDLLKKMSSPVTFGTFKEKDKVDMEQVCCILASLMHHEVTTVHMPDFKFDGDWCPVLESKVQNLVEAIGAKCPKLTSLQLTNSFYYSTFLEQSSCLRDTFFKLLPRLVHLQRLQINFFTCGDWGLQQISNHCTNLVFLALELDSKVTSVGFEALTKLRHLRQFLLNQSPPDWQTNWVHWCMQLLPHLKMIGFSFSKYKWYVPRNGHHDEVVVLQTPAKLSLEEMILSGDVQPAMGCELPELQTLFLLRPMGDVAGMCDRFQNLSTLWFYHAHMDVVESVLQRVGHRLSGLSIRVTLPKLLLGNVLCLCPNLKILTLNCRRGDVWNLPAGCLSILEEFYCIDSSLSSPGFIVQILSLPMLKKVEIGRSRLTVSELEELLFLVRHKHILQNITSIKWCNHYYLYEDESNSLFADSALFEQLLDTLEVAFPHIDYHPCDCCN